MAVIDKQVEVVVFKDQNGRKQVAIVDHKSVRIRMEQLIVDGWAPEVWNFAKAVELLPNVGARA